MKTVTWLATNGDPAVDRAARRVLEATGRLTFDGDPASLARTRVAMRGAQIDGSPPRDIDLFARVVHGTSIDGLTTVDFLDTAVIHPIGSGPARRVSDFAFGYAARTARHHVAIFDEGALRDAARETARDYAQILVHELPPDAWSDCVTRGAEEIEVALGSQQMADSVAHIMGGRGIAPGQLRGNAAIFQAALGDDPDPGAALECPYALVLAGAQMLEFLGEGMVADRLVKAVKRAVSNRALPVRLGGSVTIDEMADVLIALIA